MKKAFIYTSLIILGILSLESCQKEIDFDIPASKPQLVVNSYISITDSLIVNVGTSLSYLDSEGALPVISNADVKLYKEGNFLSDLQLDDAGSGTYKYSELITDPGTYELKVTAAGYNSASGTTKVPTISGNNAQLTTEIISEQNDTIKYKSRLVFSDPSGQRDFYHLIIVEKSEEPSLNYSAFEFNSSSPIILNETGNTASLGVQNIHLEQVIFTDDLFDGETTTVEFDGVMLTGKEYFVQWVKISEEYYLYHRSVFLSQSSGGFFTQPVQVYTNVENGLGVVAGYNTMLLPIEQ